MAKGKTKGAAKHRALPRKRCCKAAYAGYYVSAAKRAKRRWEVLSLHADLQTWTGFNASQLAGDMGALLFMALEAARVQGMNVPNLDYYLITDATEQLGVVRQRPRRLPVLRARIAKGLAAVQRIRPHLHDMWLAEGERRMRRRLNITGMLTVVDAGRVRPSRACATLSEA